MVYSSTFMLVSLSIDRVDAIARPMNFTRKGRITPLRLVRLDSCQTGGVCFQTEFNGCHDYYTVTLLLLNFLYPIKPYQTQRSNLGLQCLPRFLSMEAGQ